MATTVTAAHRHDMTRSPVDTVLCDVGDVLILFDPGETQRLEEHHGFERGSLLPTLLKSEIGRAAMVGAVSTAQWRAVMVDRLGSQVVAEWLAYHGEVNTGVVDLLRAMRAAGTRVVLLSNATRRLWDDLAFHGLACQCADAVADAVFCSADIGVAKPDADAYRYAASHAGFDLNRAVYIDDTASWVEAGESLGLRGHVYRGVSGLVRALTRWGLPCR